MMAISPNEIENKKDVALVWSIADNGEAKVTPLSDYPKQKRNGQGVVNIKLPSGANEVVAVLLGNKKTNVYVKTKRNTCKRLRLGKAEMGRRSVRPKPISTLSIGNTNRVVGVVKASSSVAEQAQELQQLTLI